MNAADIAQVKLYFGKRYPQSRFDYDGSSNCIYIAIAPRGSASSETAWLIFKLTYNGSNLVTQVQTSPENSVWDDRATTVVYG